jgi:drug/metabolite transporter (DMT)-like permease
MLEPLSSFKSIPSRLMLIAPFFLWGTAMVAMKEVMPQTTPFCLAALRVLPAGVLLVLAALVLQRPQPQGWRAWAWISLFGLIDATLFQGFLAQGLVRTTAGLGSVMIDSQPLAVALLALFLYGERVGSWGWLGLLLGIFGITCIGFSSSGTDWTHLPMTPHDFALWLLAGMNQGEVLMLLAAAAMAVGTVMIRKVCAYADPVAATGWHLVIGGVPLAIASVLFESNPITALSLGDWSAIAYASVLGSAIAYGLFFWFASRGNLTSLSSLTFLTPVFALIFGHWFLAETLSPVQIAGVFLTLVSIGLINQRDRLDAFWAENFGGRRFEEHLGTRTEDELEASDRSKEQVPVVEPIRVRVDGGQPKT